MADEHTGALADIPCIALRDGASLHFLHRGSGDPVLLVHGGGNDLRAAAIPNAAHDVWADAGRRCREELEDFLEFDG